MQEILIQKLHAYIVNNNPEVLIQLQTETKVSAYLKGKLSSIEPLLNEMITEGVEPFFIAEMCMNVLTEDLRPSRFNYIATVFEEEFNPVYRQFRFVHILRYELINMVEACKAVFDSMDFNEQNTESRLLRYAIVGAIHDYLENKKWN